MCRKVYSIMCSMIILLGIIEKLILKKLIQFSVFFENFCQKILKILLKFIGGIKNKMNTTHYRINLVLSFKSKINFIA